MAEPRITLHVAHAKFLPERAETLARLLGQLEAQGLRAVVHESVKREHASVWATRIYKAIAAEDPEMACILNDDVDVSPHLAAAMHAWVRMPTSRILSLHTVHPMARSLAEAGQRWLSTYHVTGPGYIFRKGVARQVLEYYARAPRQCVTAWNEDNILIQFMYKLREPVWNCIPALVVHDVTVPSSLGYENHPQRTASVPWTDALFKDANFSWTDQWNPGDKPVPYLETHWTPTSTLDTNEVAFTLGIDPMQCYWCLERLALFGSEKSGARICPKCIHEILGSLINAATRKAAGGPQ